MATNELNIGPDKILAAVAEHLHQAIFASSKTESKQVFNHLNAGKTLPLLEISSSTRGSVVGTLALDSSEFVGKLNYSAFRDALASHLQQAVDKLAGEEKLNILTSEETGAILFHIPGVINIEGQFNILVSAIEQRKAGELLIKLMFINPANYETLTAASD